MSVCIVLPPTDSTGLDATNDRHGRLHALVCLTLGHLFRATQIRKVKSTLVCTCSEAQHKERVSARRALVHCRGSPALGLVTALEKLSHFLPGLHMALRVAVQHVAMTHTVGGTYRIVTAFHTLTHNLALVEQIRDLTAKALHIADAELGREALLAPGFHRLQNVLTGTWHHTPQAARSLYAGAKRTPSCGRRKHCESFAAACLPIANQARALSIQELHDKS